jgi:hypothetical protein
MYKGKNVDDIEKKVNMNKLREYIRKCEYDKNSIKTNNEN